eukprot:scaffold12808_cov76-Skeletonema_dohrnii-CCMP3373.AAC.1
MSLFSTVNRKQCLQQQGQGRITRAQAQAQGHNHIIIIAEHGTKVEAIEAETAAIEAAEGHVLDIWSETRSTKRR